MHLEAEDEMDGREREWEVGEDYPMGFRK